MRLRGAGASLHLLLSQDQQWEVLYPVLLLVDQVRDHELAQEVERLQEFPRHDLSVDLPVEQDQAKPGDRALAFFAREALLDLREQGRERAQGDLIV